MNCGSRWSALAMVFVSPAFAWAHGFPGSGRTITSYYVPVQIAPLIYCIPPAYSVPSYGPTTPPPLVRSGTPAPPPATKSNTAYATPTPAPPSSRMLNGESLTTPGSPGRLPVVSEGLSYYDAYALAVRDPAKQFGERCTVTFWNLTTRPLTLKVDGRDRTLEPRQNLALDVPRRFSWQVDSRGDNKENIAMGEAGLEIVVRRQAAE